MSAQAQYNHIKRLLHIDVIAETYAIQVQQKEDENYTHSYHWPIWTLP